MTRLYYQIDSAEPQPLPFQKWEAELGDKFELFQGSVEVWPTLSSLLRVEKEDADNYKVVYASSSVGFSEGDLIRTAVLKEFLRAQV